MYMHNNKAQFHRNAADTDVAPAADVRTFFDDMLIGEEEDHSLVLHAQHVVQDLSTHRRTDRSVSNS